MITHKTVTAQLNYTHKVNLSKNNLGGFDVVKFSC